MSCEPANELYTHRVQRRGRGPGRRVEHRRARRVEAQRAQHCVAIDAAVDEAVGLRHADQADRRAVGVDGAGGDEVAQPALVDEEQPMPVAHRSVGRVESVLAADAVKDLDAARFRAAAAPT